MKISKTRERSSERAMRLSQTTKQKPLNITFEEWFLVLEKLVKAGNCLIDDVYGVHKINKVILADNCQGKATGIIFQTQR